MAKFLDRFRGGVLTLHDSRSAWILLLAAMVPAALSPAAPAQEARGPVKSVEVVILSTMLADRAGVGEWGFSALVEADGHRLLFDTGARPETVLQNARELGIDLSGVTDVVLSHHHGDHTGGLLTLRRELAQAEPRALSAGVRRRRDLPEPTRSDGARPTRRWRSRSDLRGARAGHSWSSSGRPRCSRAPG